jgi:hypothetical protein
MARDLDIQLEAFGPGRWTALTRWLLGVGITATLAANIAHGLGRV